MAIWPWDKSIADLHEAKPVQAAPAPAKSVTFALDDLVDSFITQTGGSAVTISDAWVPTVSRREILSIPAFKRGIHLISSTMASAALVRRGSNGEKIALGWLEQPEADRPLFNTLYDTFTDMQIDGVAYWQVLRRDSNGEPSLGGCKYIAPGDLQIVTVNDSKVYRINGRVVDPANIIGFARGGAPLTETGARIARIALALEAASKRYADSPRPGMVIVNKSDDSYSPEDVNDFLVGFKRDLNTEGMAFASSNVAIDTPGWNSAELQLVEARQFTATQIANVIGIPSRYIAGAAASSGGSVTYANIVQDARELVDLTFQPLGQALVSRLSMRDAAGFRGQVTPRGQAVQIDYSFLLRGNPKERAEIYNILIPLGIMTSDEARQMEDLV